MKIGVSGASGHLGRAVVSELLQRPGSHEVVSITRTPETVSRPAQGRFGDYGRPSAARPRTRGPACGRRIRDAPDQYGADQRADAHDRGTGRQVDSRPRRMTTLTIDTHHHMLPDFFWRETNAHGVIGGLAPLAWSKGVSLSFMDDAGIDAAVLSVSMSGVHTGDSLKANANGVYLGDAVLEPVFEELERHQAVVFVHPNPSPDAAAHSLGLPDNLLDFPTDTNRAVAQMHYTNRFARTPSVKYIFSHAGGSIPYLAARFAIIDEMGLHHGRRGARSRGEHVPADVLGHGAFGERPRAPLLREVVGMTRVLFGLRSLTGDASLAVRDIVPRSSR